MAAWILVVEDTENLRHDLQKVVEASRRQVVAVSNEYEAEQQIAKMAFDVVITDIKLDEAGGTVTGGLKVLQAVSEKDPTIPVIVVTAYGKGSIPAEEGADAETISVEDMVRQMGAFAYIARPHPSGDYLDIIQEAVTQALEHSSSVATEMKATQQRNQTTRPL